MGRRKTVDTGDLPIDSIQDNEINWGSGANQVDASSVPLDTGGSYGGAATNVQDALEELEGGMGGGGDMLAATYDPGSVAGDAFAMDNMVEGTTTKIMTDTERSKLSGIEDGADVTDSANVDTAGAVMNNDSTTAAMGFVIDEDNMASNLATKVPTQQSVKAYVDSAIAGVGSSSFWSDSGETCVFASTGGFEIFSVTGVDATETFYYGRGIKITQASVNSGNPFYGVVYYSEYSTDTTVGILAQYNLANESMTVEVCDEICPHLSFTDYLPLVADISNPIATKIIWEPGISLGCEVQVGVAPTGSSATFDIHINTTSDYTTATNPTIAAGNSSTSATSFGVRGDLTEFLIAQVDFYTDSVGSTIAGSAPTFIWWWIPKKWTYLT